MASTLLRSPPVDPAAGDEASLLETARRMGPLPYSARRPDPPAPLPPTPALIDWLVDAIDRWWTEAGRPDPWTVVEVGAGDGRRAAEVLARGPECLTALRYVLVAQDPAAREAHRSVLPIEAPSLLLGPIVPSDPDDPHDPDDPGRPMGGIGPLITSLSDAPVLQGPGLVLAVGWLSGLPSGRVEWRDGRWWDVLLAAAPGDAGLAELTVPVSPERTPPAAKLVTGPPGPRPIRHVRGGDLLGGRHARDGRVGPARGGGPLDGPNRTGPPGAAPASRTGPARHRPSTTGGGTGAAARPRVRRVRSSGPGVLGSRVTPGLHA